MEPLIKNSKIQLAKSMIISFLTFLEFLLESSVFKNDIGLIHIPKNKYASI